MARKLAALLVVGTLLVDSALFAQPLPTNVDICMQQDVGASVLRISLRANDQSFGDVLSGLVFTIRWSEASNSTLGAGTSAWCVPSQAFQPGPSAQVAPGNGYKYKTWTSTGFALLSELVDNGGCGQTLLADTWTEVLAIPVNNPGSTFFELIDDDFTSSDNRDYFISLNGLWIADGDTLTGSVCSSSTSLSEVGEESVGVSAFPNPTAGPVRITLARSVGATGYELVDAAGRSVRSGGLNGATAFDLDLGGCAAGVYQLRILCLGETLIRTIAVDRP